MSAPTEKQEVARLLRATLLNLKSRHPLGKIDLSFLCDEFYQTHGSRLTPEQASDYLEMTREPGRDLDNDYLSGRFSQGTSGTSHRANELSQSAAQASVDAREDDTVHSHRTAEQAHNDACNGHLAASNFHRLAAVWHSAKAEGRDDGSPEPVDSCD